MSGYCIEFYKYMRIDEDQEKKETFLKSRKEIIADKDSDTHKKFYTYGEFDYISFERINSFPRFRDISDNAKVWIGDRQTHLIYDIGDDEYNDEIFYEDGNFYEFQNGEVVQSNCLFVGITILQFKFSQKSANPDMEKFLTDCKKRILDLVDNNYPEVRCAVFGTLGSYGLTIIWLSDQYTDILNLIVKIKNIKLTGKSENTIFLSAYTIFAQNHIVESSNWAERAQKIMGSAILHITLKKGIDKKIMDKLLSLNLDSELYHCAGEHDLFVKIKAAEIFSVPDDLKWNSEFYNDYIFQTNVQLYETITKVDEAEKEACGDDMSYKKSRVAEAEKQITHSVLQKEDGEEQADPKSKIIQNEYMKLRKELAEQFPSTAGMVDTLDWLYSDYISKMSTAFKEMWREIFSHQFFSVLSSVSGFIKKADSIRLIRKHMLGLVNDLLCDFERQISHIAESNNLVLGTPVCQFRYSGQNNLTLYVCFGIIKNVLERVYRAQEISVQDEIVPLIVTDIVPVIQSKQYFDVGMYKNAKIVSINLPMTALYNPVCYYPYLYHEIFHYIVPRDRHIRNQIMGALLSIKILHASFRKIMQEKITVEKGNELLNIFIDHYLMRYIYNFTVQNYEDYIGKDIEKMIGNNLDCSEAGIRMHSSREYEREVLYKWLGWLNAENVSVEYNFMYAFISFLYLQEKNIEKEFDAWKRETDGRQKEKIQSLQKQVGEFIESLEGIVQLPVVESASQNYQELLNPLNDNIIDAASTLSGAVNEGIADTAMVALAGLDFAEYLLLYTKTKKDLLMDSSSTELQDIIRIGLVLQYLCRDRQSDDNYMGIVEGAKEAFVDMYCGLYYSSTKSKETGYYKYFNKLLEEANEWFKESKQCFYNYRNGYQFYAALLKKIQESMLLFQEDSMRQGFVTEDITYFKQYASKLREYGIFMRKSREDTGDEWNEKRSEVERHIFGLNMDLIYRHQVQLSFDELKELHDKKIEEISKKKYNSGSFRLEDTKLELQTNGRMPVIGFENYIWKYKVKSVAELAQLTADIATTLDESNYRVLGKNIYPIWYRGHQSEKYKLLPSIMRKYKEKKAKYKNPDDFTLLGFLRQEYEEFKFRSDGMPESIDRTAYTNSDYIALMQHYGAPSNFLDWTEDALSALYFALEGFLDQKVKSPDADAALYIFSPALYNFARGKMIAFYQNEDKRKNAIEKDVVTIAKQEGIPNLAVSYNFGNYDMYEFGNQMYNLDGVEKYDANDAEKNRWVYYMPLAVYVSRLNRRIRAQSGIFLAYNIYTGPDEKTDGFDYVSLESIQETYLERWKEDRTVRPFLYKIEIEETGRKKIADWVKAFGMTKEKCYPELSSVGERMR